MEHVILIILPLHSVSTVRLKFVINAAVLTIPFLLAPAAILLPPAPKVPALVYTIINRTACFVSTVWPPIVTLALAVTLTPSPALAAPTIPLLLAPLAAAPANTLTPVTSLPALAAAPAEFATAAPAVTPMPPMALAVSVKVCIPAPPPPSAMRPAKSTRALAWPKPVVAINMAAFATPAALTPPVSPPAKVVMPPAVAQKSPATIFVTITKWWHQTTVYTITPAVTHITPAPAAALPPLARQWSVLGPPVLGAVAVAAANLAVTVVPAVLATVAAAAASLPTILALAAWSTPPLVLLAILTPLSPPPKPTVTVALIPPLVPALAALAAAPAKLVTAAPAAPPPISPMPFAALPPPLTPPLAPLTAAPLFAPPAVPLLLVPLFLPPAAPSVGLAPALAVARVSLAPLVANSPALAAVMPRHTA